MDRRESLSSRKTFKRSRSVEGSPKVIDKRLLARIREYIATHGGRSSIADVTDLSQYLQKKYSEYGRRKRQAFRGMVQRVCDGLAKQDNESRLEQIENKYLQRQFKKQKSSGSGNVTPSEQFSDLSDSDSTNSDFRIAEEPLVVVKDTNMLNRSLVSVYKSGSEMNTPPVFQMEDPSKEPVKYQLTTMESGESIGDRQGLESEQSVERMMDTDKNVKPQHKKQKQRKAEGDRPKKPVAEILTTQPLVTFADVGGNESILEEVGKLLLHMLHPEVYKHLGITPPRGFLLHGPPGCGKTLLANAIAGELELPFIRVAATELVSGVSGESEEKIRELFGRCKDLAPCLLFLDEIDAITPKRDTASKDMERRIVAQLLACMDELDEHSVATGSHVLVIGATNRPDSIDPALRRAGRFDREISLGIPNEKAREGILKVLCRNLTLSGSFDYVYLARQTPGYVGADLMALMREAATVAVNRIFCNLEIEMAEKVTVNEEGHAGVKSLGETAKMKTVQEKRPLSVSWIRKCHAQLPKEHLSQLSITLTDFEVALPNVQPSAKREGFATVPDVTWDDVGALNHIRDELSLSILAPIRHADDFAALGLSASSGVLLAGPPGCGKTLLAKAIANESGINFISVKGPELLNMYVGESERAVRQVFQRAGNSAPCVIFFDEIDALCPRRSDGDNNVSARVVNQLLTEMDGLEARKHIFVMAATNRPDIIDPAVLRPGRLDKILYVGIPSPADREAILKTITKDGTKPCLDKTTDLTRIAFDERCSGFSGADLAALVREAALASLRERIDSKAAKDSVLPSLHVTQKHFEVAFAKVKPSVSSKERDIYEKMKSTKEL